MLSWCRCNTCIFYLFFFFEEEEEQRELNDSPKHAWSLFTLLEHSNIILPAGVKFFISTMVTPVVSSQTRCGVEGLITVSTGIFLYQLLEGGKRNVRIKHLPVVIKVCWEQGWIRFCAANTKTETRVEGMTRNVKVYQVSELMASHEYQQCYSVVTENDQVESKWGNALWKLCNEKVPLLPPIRPLRCFWMGSRRLTFLCVVFTWET